MKPGTLEMRVLRSLDALVTSDRVIHFKGVGYRLKTSESVEAALDRAIRRLEQVRLALKLPPESSPRWTDSAWMYARWAIVDAAPIVESELAKKGVNPPSEPSHLRLVQDDAVNAHLEVTLRGSNLSVPEDLRALGEEAFAGGIKDQLAEKCVLCNMPLPHEGKHAEFHRLIEERLPLVRDFDPLGHAHHPPCGDVCSAFWLLDYVRRSLEPPKPEWALRLPPAPPAPLEPLAVYSDGKQIPNRHRRKSGARR